MCVSWLSGGESFDVGFEDVDSGGEAVEEGPGEALRLNDLGAVFD